MLPGPTHDTHGRTVFFVSRSVGQDQPAAVKIAAAFNDDIEAAARVIDKLKRLYRSEEAKERINSVNDATREIEI